MIETWVQIQCEMASQFKKSQTAVSTTERYFTLSVVYLIVECTARQHKIQKNSQVVVGWLGCKWSKRSVLQLLSKTKRSRTIIFIYFWMLHNGHFIFSLNLNNYGHQQHHFMSSHIWYKKMDKNRKACYCWCFIPFSKKCI